MIRRRRTRRGQARELARLFAALDAAGSERRVVLQAPVPRASLGAQGRAA